MPLRQGGGPGIPSSGSITLTGDVTGTAAATVVSAISGASPILITPNVLEWTKGTANPTLTQAAPTTDVAPPNITLAPASPYASAVTNVVGGNVRVNLPAPLSGTVYSAFDVQEAGTSLLTIGTDQYSRTVLNSATGSIYINAATGYAEIQGAGGLYLDGDATGIIVRASGAQFASWTSTAFTFGAPIGGYSNGTTSGLQLSHTAAAIAFGTAGGTVQLSSAQAATPSLLVTCGVLTANATLAFTTNGSAGVWVVDIGTVTATDLASFSLVFVNGSASYTLTGTKLTAMQAILKTGVVVHTYGANTLVIL